MNDGSITPNNGRAIPADMDAPQPPPLAQTPEGLREQVLSYHAMAYRRADIIDRLANLLDGLQPLLKEAAPGWWEEHKPLDLVIEEFEGWESERIESERQRLGLYLRGPSTSEQRADLRRRTTEAGLREGKSQEQP